MNYYLDMLKYYYVASQASSQDLPDIADEVVEVICGDTVPGRGLAHGVDKPSPIRIAPQPLPQGIQLMPTQSGGETAAKGLQIGLFS